MKVILILLVIFPSLIYTSLINSAYAHPLIVKSEPSNAERLATPPSSIAITFSEPVELRFSWIRVYDSENNRVDNNDTHYLDNNPSRLGVTLRPLSDGVYTVNTRVLSQVDGHVVDSTFVFIVGDVDIPSLAAERVASTTSEQVIAVNGVAKFPSYIAYTMLIGLPLTSLYLNREVRSLKQSMYSRVRIVVIILGSMLIASSTAVVAIQSVSVESDLLQIFTSKFGNLQLIKILAGAAVIAVAYIKSSMSKGSLISLLLLGSVAMVSTTLVSHGAAVSLEATVLDLIHNLLASIWIGGVMALAFIILPGINNNSKDAVVKGQALSLIIPRFSQLALISVGILGLTGPLLLWSISDDITSTLKSTYGLMLLIKLVLAALMLYLGGHSTFMVQRRLKSLLVKSVGRGKAAYDTDALDDAYSYAHSLMKLEAYLGIALLLTVSLLTNSVPPYDDAIVKFAADTDGLDSRIQRLTSISDDAVIELTITPARIGMNSVYVAVKDTNGNNYYNVSAVEVKIKPADTRITPVKYELYKIVDDEESSSLLGGWANNSVVFASNGLWSIEVNVTRTDALNISTHLITMIKPDPSELRFDVKEYPLPYSDSIPLYLLYENGRLWVSDGSRASIWLFDVVKEEFREFRFDGMITTILSIDSDGRVWFLDPASRVFGYITSDGASQTFKVPDESLAIYIHVDKDDRIWLALADKRSLIMYESVTDITKDKYKEFRMQDFYPSFITSDGFNNVWFTAVGSQYGLIGRVEGDDLVFLEHRLIEPLAMHVSSDGTIWVSEHVGTPARITFIDPVIGIVNSYPVLDSNALPYGIAMDRIGNLWFAQHTVDKIGLLDTYRGKMVEVDTESKNTFTLWVTLDDNGNLWYAATRAAKIGLIKPSPTATIPPVKPEEMVSDGSGVDASRVNAIRYSDIIAPLLPLLIVGISLVYMKSRSEYESARDSLSNITRDHNHIN